jgi:hypothetical protein
VCLALVLATLTAHSTFPIDSTAQSTTPAVEVVRGLGFGTFERLDTVSVDYLSDSAAKFIVTGEANRLVRLSLTPVDLARTNDVLTLSIASDQCAYSTDEGMTWTSFSSGILVQEIQFPPVVDPDVVSRIQLLVGGTVIAGEGQRRGDYSGSIVLNTEYVITDSNIEQGMRRVAARRIRSLTGGEPVPVQGSAIIRASRENPKSNK